MLYSILKIKKKKKKKNLSNISVTEASVLQKLLYITVENACVSAFVTS